MFETAKANGPFANLAIPGMLQSTRSGEATCQACHGLIRPTRTHSSGRVRTEADVNWTGSRSAHITALPAVVVALVFSMAATPRGDLRFPGGGRSLPASALGSPPTQVPAQMPGEARSMTDVERGKLDAFLKQAVADNRPESLKVMIRLAPAEGADARVEKVLSTLGLKVNGTLSGGRLLLVTLKAGQLPQIAASADVARISFDAFVTPQAK